MNKLKLKDFEFRKSAPLPLWLWYHFKKFAIRARNARRLKINVYSVFKYPKWWSIHILPTLTFSDRPGGNGWNLISGFLFWQLQIDFYKPDEKELELERMLYS